MTARGRARARLLLVLPLLGALGGCATLWRLGLRFPDRGSSCPGVLVDSRALPDGLRLREQVRVHAPPDVSWGMTLAAETRRGELVVLALDGFGAKLFSIVQRGTDTQVERAFGRRMAWPPLNVLRDLHRARFGAEPGPGVVVEHRDDDEGLRRIVVWNARCGSDSVWLSAEGSGR